MNTLVLCIEDNLQYLCIIPKYQNFQNIISIRFDLHLKKVKKKCCLSYRLYTKKKDPLIKNDIDKILFASKCDIT